MNYLKCQYFTFNSVLCCIITLDIPHMCVFSEVLLLSVLGLFFGWVFFVSMSFFPHAGSSINSSDLTIYNIVSSDAVLLEYGM